MNILPVVYVSQLTGESGEHNNDCGAASSLMLLRTYNLANTVTVNQFYNSIYPSGDYALSASQMQSKMAGYGLKTTWKVDMTIENCFTSLREKKPILALIHYGALVDAGVTERTSFRGAHFLVVTGIDLESVYLHDPYRTDGEIDIVVSHSVFELAWSQCTLDGNPVGGAVIPILPIQDLSVPQPVGVKYAIISNVNGLNVRSQPNQYSSLVKTIWRTVTPYVYCTGTPTWTPPGMANDLYIQLQDLSGWVYYNYLKLA